MTNFFLKVAGLMSTAAVIGILFMGLFGRYVPYSVLAYTSREVYNTPEISLSMYDLGHGISATVLPIVDFYDFSFSADGRLAFSLIEQDNAEIYIANTQFLDAPPINIPHNLTTDDYPLGWSPDGRFLAFASYIDEQNALIYVWDGKKAINITPENMPETAEAYSVSWSLDGRLAFNIQYGFTAEAAPSEIYLWDGNTTTNLSQTPFDGDYVPTWSEDGRLAFLSTEGGKSQIIVWDGASLKDGLPDRTSFIRVAPELSGFYSYPTWTNDEMLAFTLYSEQADKGEIYVWDGQTATNISQNPNTHNSSPSWSPNGYWVFMTSLSPYAPPITGQSLHIRDRHNNPIDTIDNSIYASAWSAENQLLFCKPYFVLSLWNGQKIIEVARSGNIYAQWPGGEGVVCTSG
jgi:Tol biopolymer transport system component